jgi:hypothetical protein
VSNNLTNIEAARAFIDYCKVQHNLIEIRGIGAPEPWRTMAGWFDDPMAAARAANLMSERGANVYYSLNIINERADLIKKHRRNGLYTHAFVTAKDQDIFCRTNILVDCDPCRAEEFKDSSASEEEKGHAFELLGRARAAMAAMFPGLLPVVIDSGSGFQAIYRCSMAADDESRVLIGNLLHYLAGQLDTDKAKIDQAVFNAARIARLPGFLNRRGPEEPGRPHRLARVIEYPWTEPGTKLRFQEWGLKARDLRASGFGGQDPDLAALAGFGPPVWWGVEKATQVATARSATAAPMAVEPIDSEGMAWPPNFAAQPASVRSRSFTGDARSGADKVSGKGRPFIATVEEVRRYIADYPEYLEPVREAQVGDVRYFALASCPFKGAAHRDMWVGHGKVTIQLWPDNMGFKCFSDDHQHLKFYDLYCWLIERTGRRSTAKLWGPAPDMSQEDLDRAWGIEPEGA